VSGRFAAGVPGRELKMKLNEASKPHIVDELHHALEVVVGFARESRR
jgi:hypothetical protein